MPTFEDPGDLQPSDWPGAPPAVLGYFNRALRRIRAFLRARFGLSTNIDCDVQTLRCTHGTELVLKSRLTSVRGLTVLSAAGQVVENARLIANGGQPRLTVYFASGSGSADVTVVLWPDGCASGTSTSYYPALRTSLFSAKGSLISSSAAGIPGELPAAADGYVLTLDAAQALGVKWAVSGGGIPTGAAMWVKPASPDSRDEEFDGTNTWTAHAATRDGSIDPYAAITTAGHYRDSFNSYWPGWYACQPNRSGGGDAAGLDKLITCNTNDLIWWRWKGVQGSNGHSAGNGVRAFLIGDGTLGSPTNYCGISVNDGGSNPSVSLISSTGNSDLIIADSLSMTRIEYCALHKIGSTTHGWVAGAGGEWVYLGSKTLGATITQMRAYGYNGAITTPGNPFFGFDFVRFIANTTTQLPPNT